MDFLKKFFNKKETEEHPSAFPAHEHDHSPLQEADPYKSEVAHRRLAWLLRISVFVSVSSACVAVAAIDTINNLAESFEPKIALLRVYEKDDKLYRVEPIEEDVEGFDILMEAKAKRYVRLMLEIDDVTQTERFKEAFRMTDTAYYKRFKKDRIDSGAIKDFMDAGGIRSITVESIDSIENEQGVFKYAVDYTQTDRFPGQKPEVKPARAYLTMTTRPHEVREVDKYENPLGITVLDMALKEKANS